jgi:hypothetical protein
MRPPHDTLPIAAVQQTQLPVPNPPFPQFGGNSFGQSFPPTSLILSLAAWLFG